MGASVSRFSAVLGVQFRRMPRRPQFRIAVTVSLGFVAIAFTETCFRFFGADCSQLPSPATAWAWNMDVMQVNSMRVYLHFFMLILAALMFSDAAAEDIRRGVAGVIASRTSIGSFVLSHVIVAFTGGFLLVLSTLVLLQALAIIAFPPEGVMEGALGVPLYTRDLLPDEFIFSDLYRLHPYLYNSVFMVWSALWAGLMSVVSLGISLLMRRMRAIALVIPGVAALVLYSISSSSSLGIFHMLFFRLVTPGYGIPLDSSALFFGEPVFLFIVAAGLVVAARAKGRDLLL
ncbi:MAG: hypothetical protein E7001_01505 [Coriobacteriaceae bacterium]|nr:hypothetical protein [Coriobacteriaceae bacterium]